MLAKYAAHYHVCDRCRSLLVVAPHWLEEAYTTTFVPDPDQGALARTMFIHRCIRRMRARSVRFIPYRCRTLDYGTGRGLLLRLLLDERRDAWGFDPYPIAVLGEDRVRRTLPDGLFDLITLIEVLEHTLDPVPTLQRLAERLEPDGLLLASTEFFDASVHTSDWHYLVPQHGQHVTLFSSEGLTLAAERAGLRWIGSLHWGGKPFAHLLVKATRRISPFRFWQLRRRHARGERRGRRDRNT
ncbi:MAG: hypothetical protein NVS4B3_17680 [Gemmatimonadaceae bacterium]